MSKLLLILKLKRMHYHVCKLRLAEFEWLNCLKLAKRRQQGIAQACKCKSLISSWYLEMHNQFKPMAEISNL